MSDTNETLKAILFITAMKAHIEAGGRMLDVVMPNGKRLGKCNGAELVEMAVWLEKIGDELNRAEQESMRDTHSKWPRGH
jgi:hypothetical protein